MTLHSYQIKKSRRVAAVLFAASITGVLSALIADTLKVATEHYEELFIESIHHRPYLIFILPFIGLATIYVLRHFLFRNKANKGIKEVMDTINKDAHMLPAYKIPSHYFNGLLTVVFGGSTGIEVSTVVSTAAIGALSSRKASFLKKYRTDLICSGLAAGLTALFNAPLAGFLFAFEVFTKRRSKLHHVSVVTAIVTSWLITHFLFYKPLFQFNIKAWHIQALPYMVLLAVLAGLNAVYLTKCVLFFKKLFGSFKNDMVKIAVGSLSISALVFMFPGLYGEGYAGIKTAIATTNLTSLTLLLPLLIVMLLKPVATSVTLGAGGDGGVFAPSLFMGAFLGLIVSHVLNMYFHLGLIPINFVVIGMAAVLSGSIHAPFTAIFLACAIADSYVLFIPIVLACLISRWVAGLILPYSVYSYRPAVRPLP
ncbi:H(+)/Cl(-) exchange transporter ClcA [Dyadobacter sp. CECT 9623]|uniref:H(+)/Cl(-) exchange transporter ClcA n=1 Tax=Dyadobacter linearis TaxID=2823330 RepID=A0ABN7RBP0_9BACT|nr:chloride channel protein [Dyadobacter sp. CECT 9623]CAG5072421.1 H(+)/Cl(-) exchange transporter ClcA [Dyadobacter sp. CECT 9623]